MREKRAAQLVVSQPPGGAVRTYRTRVVAWFASVAVAIVAMFLFVPWAQDELSKPLRVTIAIVLLVAILASLIWVSRGQRNKK